MTRMRYLGFGCVWTVFLVIFIGCGGGDATKVTESTTETSEATPSEPAPVKPTATEPTTPDPPPTTSLVHQRGGKDWIGDVPLDVWFDDPLAIASAAGNVAEVQPNQVEKIANVPVEPMPMPMEAPAATAGGIDWKRVIPGAVLDAEVTAIRNRFTADLQTVGSYNSSYLGLPPHAVTLAVLSHIAEQHPDDIRWKKNASYIKHLAGQMNAEPLRSGPGSHKPLKEKFDNIVEILNGSVPATLDPPPENEALQEVAKIAYLMKRLENAAKLITVNGGTPDAMKSNAAQLKQEAAVLGALTQALLDGYEDYKDDEMFAAYVKSMVDTSVELQESVQNDQFDKFELAVSKMNQTCDQCHGDYR